MIGLTHVQNQCLDFLRSYHAENGVMPTVQEITDQFGWDSKSAAARVLDRLVDRGYIRRSPRKARAIEIVDPAQMHAVLLSKEVFALVQAYAAGQRISVDCAVSEIVREAMGAS